MAKQFTDSCHDCFELTQELLRGMPPDAQKRAKRAATIFIETWEKLKADAPKDPAVAVGSAFAVFFIADTIINGNGPVSDNMIVVVGG